jgi:hypothetical protein
MIVLDFSIGHRANIQKEISSVTSCFYKVLNEFFLGFVPVILKIETP